MSNWRAIARWLPHDTAASARRRLTRTFVDLGRAPLSNAFLSGGAVAAARIALSAACLRLRMLPAGAARTGSRRRRPIFGDYAYFSSYSDAWLRHAEQYAARMIEDACGSMPTRSSSRSPATTATCCNISAQRGIGVLGVEPAANVAEVAQRKGIADRGRVLRCGRRAAAGAAQAGRPDRGQQRARARAGPQRFRRRASDPAEAGRHRSPSSSRICCG